jgi:hypothetical protein
MIFGKVAEKHYSHMKEFRDDIRFDNYSEELMKDPLTASLLKLMEVKVNQKPIQKINVE